MSLYLIKILGIFLVTVCCLIATYTDVKWQIIPNKLTFSLFFIGLFIVTYYFYETSNFNVFYYCSIPIVFIFSYLLWYAGVWAGGDVKLFTAISTILIPDFLLVIPKYNFLNFILPVNLLSFKIPTFLLIFNSILSIVPVVVLMVLLKIFKDKPYLIKDLKKTLNFKDALLSLNSLIISHIIISEFNVYHPLLKMVIVIILFYIFTKIKKHEFVFIVLSVTVFFEELFLNSLLLYLYELLFLVIVLSIKEIYKKGIIKEALTESIKLNDLKEGMILAYPLYYDNTNYYFNKNNMLTNIKNTISKKDNGKLICGVKSSGLTSQEVQFIKSNLNSQFVPIKEGLSFAPFILTGLFITFFIGNTVDLTINLLEML